jgi:hypothetical protein
LIPYVDSKSSAIAFALSSFELYVNATLIPSFANLYAQAFPIPFVAPVITNVFAI